MAPNSKQSAPKLRVWPLASLLTAALLAACSTTPCRPGQPGPAPRRAMPSWCPRRCVPGLYRQRRPGNPCPCPCRCRPEHCCKTFRTVRRWLPLSRSGGALQHPGPATEQRRAFTTNAELNHWLGRLRTCLHAAPRGPLCCDWGRPSAVNRSLPWVLTRARDTHPDSLAATKRPRCCSSDNSTVTSLRAARPCW